jgi:hypothetical protein
MTTKGETGMNKTAIAVAAGIFAAGMTGSTVAGPE